MRKQDITRGEAGRLLLSGLSPQQIADRLDISIGTVAKHFCTLIGEGTICATDVALSIKEGPEIEKLIQSANWTPPVARQAQAKFARRLKDALLRSGANIPYEAAALFELYLINRDPRPELYSLICDVEVCLHRFVRHVLKRAYRDNWWKDGIPLNIRKECQTRREEDDDPDSDPYVYTTFINLKDILDKKWNLFADALPTEMRTNKQKTLSDLVRLNLIRNRVMHPVKNLREYKDDFYFLKEFLSSVSDLPQSL